MSDASNELVQSSVVCPHCWHKFYRDEALFISRHAELYGDPVLGDHENRRFPPHEVTHNRNGDVLDPKGWKMTERACPVCHLQIPIELLARRPFIISVVGAPRSGKSYFLASMLYNLRRDLATNFALSLQDSDSHDVKAFQEYERTLFYPTDASKPTILQKTQEQGALYNIVRLDNVDVQLPKPFIFTIRPTEANPDWNIRGRQLNRDVVLYDNAGESFDALKEKAGNIRVTQHLSRCDAVLFAFDPLQIADTRVRLTGVSQDPQLYRAAVTNRQENVLQEVVNRMRRHRNVAQSDRLSPPLLVCIQKYDVWKSLVPHAKDPVTGADRVDASSIMYSQSQGIAGLDVEELNLISLLLRNFIHDLSPEFVAQAESNFEIVRYLAVSALGTSPSYDEASTGATGDMLKIRPMDLRPFRVTDPLLWLLQRWQLIRKARSRHGAASSYPPARIEDLGNQRLRVISPLTGRVMLLDREYAGSMIVDPEVGKLFSIPPLSTASAKPTETSPGPSPAVAAPPAPLKLKQPEPPKAPKRGWFGG